MSPNPTDLTFYYAVWQKKCWKCKRDITVAINVEGWSFVPGGVGELWRQEMPDWLLKYLRSLGANIHYRKTSMVKEGYYANVCPYCNAVQGDWFLNEELINYLYEEKPQNFKIVEIRKEGIVRQFNSVREADAYYNRAK
ncbi:hypothetical protein [Geoglobus ahangari]|nr:hypothetical protein [Geoglobus ahangari]